MQFNSIDKEIIHHAVNNRTNIFLHGAGGVGKTTILNEIVRQLEINNRNVRKTALTGVAAVLIGGVTLHRYAGIGLGDGDKLQLLRRVSMKKNIKRDIIETEILIIDEISMCGAELFDKINFVFKKIRKNERPFGGMQIILVGDMLQLEPIKDAYIFKSEVWDKLNLKIYNLTISKRYNETNYFDLLLRIRENKHTQEDISILKGRYDEYIKIKNEIKGWEIKPTFLFSKRIDVDEYNMKELSKIQGDQYDFENNDDFVFKPSKYDDEYTERKISASQIEFYTNLLDNAIPQNISLKVGAQVMLKKNLDVEAGLCNGSKGVVMEINEQTEGVLVKFKNGVSTYIFKDKWEIKEGNVLASREQIPLVLAYAMTIHKSQGSTLDCAIVDLGYNIFADNQAYVALSRVRDISGLYLSDFDETSLKSNKDALEFVKKLNS